MCRIAYFPINSETLWLLKHLEKVFGGDGNGVAWFNEKLYIKKSVNLSVKEIAKIIQTEKNSSGFLFHTRRASSLSISSENCHPFSYSGKVATCHNGHWNDYRTILLQLVISNRISPKVATKMTDSATIAFLVDQYGFKVTKLIRNGVIFSLYKDHAKVAVFSKDFCFKKFGETYIYASEFPDNNDVFEFDTGTIAKLYAGKIVIVQGGYDKKRHTFKYYYFKGSNHDIWDYNKNII